VAYGVHFKPSAADAIRKLPKSQQRRVIAKAEALAETPRPPGCRKLLGEDELYRVRVGDYRIVYAVRDQDLIILVVRVGHRREVYRMGS
jgi:mRNA interferase RelE/StbE